MIDKILHVVASALMVVLTLLVLNLHSELEMARNEIEAVRVDMTVASDVRPRLGEIESRLSARIEALEGKLEEQRLQISAIEERTGTVLKRIAKILKDIGADPISLEMSPSASVLPLSDARAMMKRSLDPPYREKRIELAIGATTPALIDFPAEVLSVERLASTDLRFQTNGGTLVLYSSGGLDEDVDSLRVALENGDSYALRVRWASRELGRTIAAELIGSGSGAALRQKGREFSVTLGPSGAASVILPAAIAAGFARRGSPLLIESSGNVLVMKAGASLDEKGEAVLVKLVDGRAIALRGKLASAGQPVFARLDLSGGEPRVSYR